MTEIGVILLAIDGPTPLLPFRGTTLLRHAVNSAMETGYAPIVVVLGAEAADCEAELAEMPVHIALDSGGEKGAGGSIALGLEALLCLAPKVEAALIMRHDQPHVPAVRLNDLAREWDPPAVLAVASVYGDGIGLPAVFDRALFAELTDLAGPQGMMEVLQAHAAELAAIDMPEGAADIEPDDERLS